MFVEGELPPHIVYVTVPDEPGLEAINNQVSQVLVDWEGVVEGVGVGVTVIEHVGVGVYDGVFEGVLEGVCETDGVNDLVGVNDGVDAGVTYGTNIVKEFNNLSKLVILILVICDNVKPYSYKHWNTLLRTCGDVFSFTFKKQLLLNAVDSNCFSLCDNGVMSLDETLFVIGSNEPVNLKFK